MIPPGADRLRDPNAGDPISAEQARIQNELLRRFVKLPNSITDSSGTRMVVRSLAQPQQKLFGKLDGDLAAGSSATMSVWEGTTLADSGRNVTVYDWFLPAGKKLKSGAKVAAVWYSGKWYVDTTDTCPS